MEVSEKDINRKGQACRQLRDRKERKHYTDDWAIGDEEIEGKRTFSVDEMIETDRFSQCYVKELNGTDFNLAYLQRYGFTTPLIFKEKTGLGLRIPSNNFTVNDVRMCVGSRRVLDVMDVNTQKNLEMTMKEWQKYYEDPHKDKLLNVISLEFSHTKLENYVHAPIVVRQIDWVERVWPRHLKDSQTESTNVLEEMMYPKVQKYCLMSIKGCYTDFHVDFGGTSVWYHILRGSKIFWLIPPTEKNISLYEDWVLSGKQGDVFFGDMVEKCGRVTLAEGNTFFIPTGWIHAVFTPKDSLVFGGNFLHSFGIEKQLKIAQVEDATHVPQKFRYPFFTEMLWYVLERYVHCLLGRTHLMIPDDIDEEIKQQKKHVHLTKLELHGLKAIVMYLHALPTSRKNVPDLIKDPISLVRDVRDVVERHRNDIPEEAITGIPILKWDDEGNQREGHYHSSHQFIPNRTSHRGRGGMCGRKSPGCPRVSPNNGTPRRRRTRCKTCEACLRDDCGDCSFCVDMVKFGGPGRMKQTCTMRQCLQPMLPVTAICIACQLDGWGKQPVLPVPKTPRNCPSALMECSVCYEIIHPNCAKTKYPDVEGVVNEDLPNSWECPICCKEGRNVDYKPRHFKARTKTCDPPRRSSDVDRKDLIKTEHGDIDDTMSVRSASPNYVQQLKRKITEDSMSSESKIPKTEYTSEEHSPYKHDSENVLTEIVECTNKGMPEEIQGNWNWDEKNCQSVNCCRKNASNLPELSPIRQSEPVSDTFSEHNEMWQRSQDLGTRFRINHCVVQVKKLMDEKETIEERDENSLKLAQNPTTSRVPFCMQLVHQLTSNSTKQLKSPLFVVRPASDDRTMCGSNGKYQLKCIEDRTIMLKVFSYLRVSELQSCMLVCHLWNEYCLEPCLWKNLDLSHSKITARHLTGVIRRQPSALVLDWTNVSKKQLGWLIARLPQMKKLSLQGCHWMTIIALRTCNCPSLSSLNLSFVQGLNDSNLREILSPPPDSRPGLVDSKSRLRNLSELYVTGSEISDIALHYIMQQLHCLKILGVSSCHRITDAGVAQLATPPAHTMETLKFLDLSGCSLITDGTLDHLKRCTNLVQIDCRYTSLSNGAFNRFKTLKTGWNIKEEKLLFRSQ